MGTKTFNTLLTSIKEGQVSNNQLVYMMSILNGSDVASASAIKELLNDSEFEGLNLTDEQVSKGLKWLNNLWMSPTKNNPFGYREQDVLKDTTATITMKGYYDAGNYYHSFNVPIYEVTALNGGGFEYVVSGGEIKIIG